ncbi:glycosyltransferase family 4 protein [Aquibacillus rhizosphaerae]|uniref:Glycosyltransferase family 4 protein n=1 Tax=Aquibacillus rhizosphaerae TaxID=3051431 RepID=A0ABT7L2S5_9BACI|nr:glycosyltransferase family 4 protein [Aquibacillus sp. LR5S19]MDL4838885.1 glycosyltransferase family 4 protein [Aquibacillus sp. LR5S19]
MNILLTTIFDFPHTGGLSTHVDTLKKGLEEQGHKVDVLSFSDVNKTIQLGYVKGPSFLMNRIVKGSGIIWSQKARQRLLLNTIQNFLKNNKVDIINSQDAFATLASIQTNIPTVMTTHGYAAFEMISKGSVPENSPQAKQMHDVEVQAYQGAGQVLTVDQRIREYIKDKANVEAISIKNFINITDFTPNKDKQNDYRKKYNISESTKVLFIPRRLTRKNGVIQPVKALPKVLEQFPDTQLLFAGEGEERSAIESLASKLGIKHNITLLGSVSHHTMKEYYSLSDIVLVPSIHSKGVEEATSISALEAMGSGTPIIAGAVGGLKELIDHNVHGLLVNAEDPNELAQSITLILQQPDNGESMAKNARKKIEEEHSHIAAAEHFLNAYKSLYDRAQKNV